MATDSRPVLSRTEIVVLALAGLVELGWWWSRTKLRIEAAIPWTLRRRLGWRPH
jgi:hypothetical protein